MTSARQIYLGSRRGPAFPYDAEVEYLESTGTQWIDTGYTSNHRDEVISAVINNHTDVNKTQAIFGVWGPDTSSRLQLIKISARMGGAYVSYSMPGHSVITVTADQPNKRFVIAGQNYTATGMSPVDIVSPLSIFVRNNGGVMDTYGVFRLYGFTIARSGQNVMDLQPVRFTNEQGVSEGAMYDRASGQLFRNSGTGVFGFGTDIAGGGING